MTQHHNSWIFKLPLLRNYAGIVIGRHAFFKGGLARSMRKYGLSFQGKKHRAGDDAFNTFRTHTEMLKRLKESGKFDR